MSHNKPLHCSTCGHPQDDDATFCEKCGTRASNSSTVTASVPIEGQLRGFRFRLIARCPRCAYQGLMGWNKVKLPISLWVLLPLGLIGFLPAAIGYFVVQKKKRYLAECPNCKESLSLPPNEVKEIKSAWGGAQVFDASGKTVSAGTLLASVGKWALIGAGGFVGLVLLFAFIGLLMQKSGLSREANAGGNPAVQPAKGESVAAVAPSITPAPAIALIGTYEGDGGTNGLKLEVADVSDNSLRFRLIVTGVDQGRIVERGRIVADAALAEKVAHYESPDGTCKIDLDFRSEKISVAQTGLCGFDVDGLASSNEYEKTSSERPTLQ